MTVLGGLARQPYLPHAFCRLVPGQRSTLPPYLLSYASFLRFSSSRSRLSAASLAASPPSTAWYKPSRTKTRPASGTKPPVRTKSSSRAMNTVLCRTPVWCYARATQSPVLRSAMLLPGALDPAAYRHTGAASHTILRTTLVLTVRVCAYTRWYSDGRMRIRLLVLTRSYGATSALRVNRRVSYAISLRVLMRCPVLTYTMPVLTYQVYVPGDVAY
eukprot:3723034-Rhodomonas_salina.2